MLTLISFYYENFLKYFEYKKTYLFFISQETYNDYDILLSV